MGNICGAEDDPEARKVSNEIDKQLARDGKIARGEVKLLLLGPGESGKSTIFKQMKIIQINGGYSSEELSSFKYIVYGNCITQMKVIVNAAINYSIPFQSKENEERAQTILQVPAGGDAWTPDLGKIIKTLWSDSGVQQAYTLRGKAYHLNDSASYFFENIDRFLESGYIPTEQDALRARVRSTGIEEAEFKFSDLSFRMLDVGGQRSERRKWIHCFDSVTAVIFCVSMSEYDQMLREDDTQNRTLESLMLFDEICNSPWFRETAFILFLNKIDLFREKIQSVDLNVCFPNYTGGCNFEAASEFLKNRFLEQNTSPHVIFVHYTCAISTENIEFVFKCVRETLLKNILSEIF